MKTRRPSPGRVEGRPVRQPVLTPVVSEAEIIRRLTAALLRFASPNGAHLALRSVYSPRGVCETTAHLGRCSKLCVAWHEDIELGARYLETAPAAPDAGAQQQQQRRAV